jgi:formamidopyrimidine-DNA glycosylase
MSGAFLIQKPETELSKHIHVIFVLDNGLELRFKDLRAFGRMNLYESSSQVPNLALAPEPLEQAFTLKHFELSLQKCSGSIKAVLLDQRKVVSGIGNIYADEALFASGINPNKKANLLNKNEIQKLYKSIQEIIKASIEAGGTTIRDYVSTEGNLGEYALQLFVYEHSVGFIILFEICGFAFKNF